MVKDNKGISLVELIITIGILVIVGSAIAGFVMVGMNQYQASNAEVNLQYEAQLAMNQIQDILIDATNGITYSLNDAMVGQDAEYIPATGVTIDKKVICSYNREKTIVGGVEQVVYTAVEIRWNDADDTLLYSRYQYHVNAEGGYTRTAIVTDTLLAQYVSEFFVDLTDVATKNQVKIRLNFLIGNRNYETSRNITLRNKVMVNKTVEEAFKETAVNLVPKVTKVVVTPAHTYVEAGSSFEGFQAKVIGINYPIQDVEWSILNISELTQPAKTAIDAATGKLTIDENETCKEIKIAATSVQSKINAGTDTSGYVVGTATVLNKYINKEGAVTLSDITAKVDLTATAEVVIHGENFEGLKDKDYADKIQLTFQDEEGKVVHDIDYTVKRSLDQSGETESYYTVNFESPTAYADKKIMVEAKFRGQRSEVKQVVFKQRTLKSVYLQVKDEDGNWEDYYSGEERPSKRGEEIDFQLVATYINEDAAGGEEKVMITEGDENWSDINWQVTFNGEANPDLEKRMINKLSQEGVLQLSSSEHDFKAQSKYLFAVSAGYRGQSASIHITLPKVTLKINQAHDSTQNSVGMVVGTTGSKEAAVLTFNVEGLVTDENTVQLNSDKIDGVNVIRWTDDNKYTIWVSEKKTFDLVFGLNHVAGITAQMRIVAVPSNVKDVLLQKPYYIPPQNNDITFFKGTQWTYYDLYGNKFIYKSSGAATLGNVSYQYSLKDGVWYSY